MPYKCNIVITPTRWTPDDVLATAEDSDETLVDVAVFPGKPTMDLKIYLQALGTAYYEIKTFRSGISAEVIKYLLRNSMDASPYAPSPKTALYESLIRIPREKAVEAFRKIHPLRELF